ncbi:MAG TPA: 6-carboxytetrahydropterin synthase, partial [Candidatus Deferrimicrobium sp.]|nr:6-carboxytetrahydropterin synthase [Candidatus Deferrimicrobium sp.]
MYLTISKRLEFSASYRYQVRKWSEENNRAFFGPEGGGSHGIGSNFTAYFVFGGSPDAKSGMLINVADIKQRAGHLLAQRYDHKFLNEDTPPFDEMVPTPENIARQLLSDAAPLFANRPAQLAVCHLTMTPTREASAYA